MFLVYLVIGALQNMFFDDDDDDDEAYISVAVVGCADLELNNGALMERKAEDELIVRCPGSRETWYMTCGSDNKWIGEVFNCSSSELDCYYYYYLVMSYPRLFCLSNRFE